MVPISRVVEEGERYIPQGLDAASAIFDFTPPYWRGKRDRARSRTPTVCSISTSICFASAPLSVCAAAHTPQRLLSISSAPRSSVSRPEIPSFTIRSALMPHALSCVEDIDRLESTEFTKKVDKILSLENNY